MSAIHVLGIRHHGPGSARNVKDFLERTQPDIVLVEGPPDAEGILQWAVNEDMKPPVAILAYQPDNLARSVFFPFAEFSPEWQAILYAKKNNIHVRFMDLPMAHMFAITQAEEEKKSAEAAGNENEAPGLGPGLPAPSLNNLQDEIDGEVIYSDPIQYLAEAAGYADGERWWDQFVEQRQGADGIFEAVAEAMQSLRESLPQRSDREEALREAWMRKTIRQAEREMFQNIAVICGAWHVPALKNMPKQKDDNDLLKGLPKVKVECTWIPWSYGRLSYHSGYGAGIMSPGWYEHVWKHPGDDGTRWMAGVAGLFRKQQMDTSVAHVIEAVRLAAALAALRNLPRPGLEELNEATLAVICNGEAILMKLIRDELIVSNRIGQTPGDIPKPPLQADIEKNQKRLRLQVTAESKEYLLDLRAENDLERSIFLHRLLLLGIKWGRKSRTSGKGTFKEQWTLKWEPALSIDIIEKGNWGNTVEEATSKFVARQAEDSKSLKEVSALLEGVIPAELEDAARTIIRCISNLAASAGDVMQLMEAAPSLVAVSRYGNVRKTDTSMVLDIVKSIIARICVSLPSACTSVNEDAARELLEMMNQMNDAVSLLQVDETSAEWQHTVTLIAGNAVTAPVIGGYATRVLFDGKILAGEELISKFSYAMSPGNDHAVVSAWVEGFLRGSGMVLLLDDELWNVIDNWVGSLDEASFNASLPVLRRTFANFNATERKKMGEKARMGTTASVHRLPAAGLDTSRANRGLTVVARLLGIPR